MRVARLASRRRGARRGFTLLEMILALAIFIGSVAVLSRLVLIGIENAEYSRWQAHAALIAESRFHELEAGILTIDQVGDVVQDPDYPEWEWTMSAQPADLTGLYLVTVEVRNVQRLSAKDFVFRLSRMWLEDSEVSSE